MTLTIAVTALLGLYRQCIRNGSAPQRRVIVIGIDGMDYAITRGLIEQGRLPNLAALAREGDFRRLQTSMPPLSPVAWSNFITGTDPGGHGVFDFLRRDAARVGAPFGESFLPEDGVGATRTVGNEWPVPFTSYVWPARQEQVLLRARKPFWQVLEEAGTPATVYKMPANFPAAPSDGLVLSGMGTPDIRGTYGNFTLFTDQPADVMDGSASGGGGATVRVTIRDDQVRGDDNGGPLRVRGPINPFRRSSVPAEDRRIDVPLDVFVDPAERTAVINVANAEDAAPLLLREREWSPWVTVSFDLLPLSAKSVRGNIRFYLQSAAAPFRLFASAVNLAPGTDGLAAGGLDGTLHDALGPYYTKGMPEESKAMLQGILRPDEYVAQSGMVVDETVRALEFLLSHRKQGLLFVYFSTLDLNCHVLWRFQDPAHPANFGQRHGAALGQSILELYAKLDAIIGNVRAGMTNDDVLYVISDHGFAPVHRELNLMNWLADEGYLVYEPGADLHQRDMYAGIDWSRTRVYPVGFQGLFVNLRGREAGGCVEPDQYDALVNEVRAKLSALRDPVPSAVRPRNIFQAVYRPEEIYSDAEQRRDAPDLLLGYARGYGPSDDGVLGSPSDDGAAIADHVRGFSGHHTNDFETVPGVLFCSSPLNETEGDARLQDVTVTLLNDLEVAAPSEMTGRSLKARR